MIAVRSPERREQMRKFDEQISERVLGLILESKDRWESQINEVKEDNPNPESKVTYEEAKDFFESKKYSFDVTREHHIQREMSQIDSILPHLSSRKWILITSNKETGPFITTDRPMNLSWKDPDSIPPAYRSSPGFGLPGTEVYFPISQELALIGEFEGRDETVIANEKLVAALNTKMLFNYYKQIYTPKFDFKYIGKGNIILSGKDLFKEIGA